MATSGFKKTSIRARIDIDTVMREQLESVDEEARLVVYKPGMDDRTVLTEFKDRFPAHDYVTLAHIQGHRNGVYGRVRVPSPPVPPAPGELDVLRAEVENLRSVLTSTVRRMATAEETLKRVEDMVAALRVERTLFGEIGGGAGEATRAVYANGGEPR